MDIKPTKNKINVKVVEKQVSRIKTNVPVLKELEVEVNEPISVDVKEYIDNLDDIDHSVLRDFKLDTSLVNLTQPGKYTYTISYDGKKYTGNVVVKEKEKKTISLQIKSLKFKLNEEIPTDVKQYVDTELTEEMLKAITLDISKVNNKVAGDYQYTISSVKLNTEAQTTKLMEQNVERLRNAGSRHRVALDDGLIGLGASHGIIGLDGEDFLQHVAGSEGLQCPYLHLTEALATELCLTTERLLGNEAVRANGT
jgi:hypothetical protein